MESSRGVDPGGTSSYSGQCERERNGPRGTAANGDGFDQSDELPLVRRELRMLGGDNTAKVGHRLVTLVQDRTETRSRGVTVHHKLLGKIWQLQQWFHGHSLAQDDVA